MQASGRAYDAMNAATGYDLIMLVPHQARFWSDLSRDFVDWLQQHSKFCLNSAGEHKYTPDAEGVEAVKNEILLMHFTFFLCSVHACAILM